MTRIRWWWHAKFQLECYSNLREATLQSARSVCCELVCVATGSIASRLPDSSPTKLTRTNFTCQTGDNSRNLASSLFWIAWTSAMMSRFTAPTQASQWPPLRIRKYFSFHLGLGPTYLYIFQVEIIHQHFTIPTNRRFEFACFISPTQSHLKPVEEFRLYICPHNVVLIWSCFSDVSYLTDALFPPDLHPRRGRWATTSIVVRSLCNQVACEAAWHSPLVWSFANILITLAEANSLSPIIARLAHTILAT